MTDTMPTHYPESDDRSASTRNGNTIACSICGAVYTPVQIYEYLLQAPRVALESAFMSMCHFCFRCRRPACPSCWDYVHGVCGSCALEAHLPFRSPNAPLHGVLFPPIRQAQLKYKRAPQARLICIHPGKFQNVSPIDSAETILTETIATDHISHQTERPDIKTTPAPPVAPLSKTQSVSLPTRVNIDEIVTKPERLDDSDIDKIATKPEHLDDIDKIATKPGPHHNISTDEIVTRPGQRRGSRRRIKRIIASILLALLLFVVALIILAAISQNANTVILKIAHINIRVEIAYILQLIRQVFS